MEGQQSSLLGAGENGAENQPNQRAAVEQLPDQGHGHIQGPGVDPFGEAGGLEQQCGNQAHHRAHDADDHGGNGGKLMAN